MAFYTRDMGALTGWPPGLLQDDHALFSRWLATRMDAGWLLRQPRMASDT